MHGHGNSFIPEVILVEETRVWWYSEPTNYKPSLWVPALELRPSFTSKPNTSTAAGFLIQRGKYSATIHFRPRPCTLWRLLLLFNKGYCVSLTECLIVSLGSIIDLYLLIDIYEWSHMKDFTHSHRWMNYWKVAIDLIQSKYGSYCIPGKRPCSYILI